MGEGPWTATVRQIVLGRRLEQLRLAAGLSPQEAAGALRVNHTTIRRIERAQVGLRYLQARALLELYGCSPEETEDFLARTEEARKPGWWHHFRDVLPDWFRAYVSMEESASLIRTYDPNHVTGLFQTEDYARAVLHATSPHAPADELDRKTALRMQRQDVLARENPPRVWAVMEEAALRRPAGETTLMRAQVQRLTDACQHPDITIQIIPFNAGLHPGLSGPFTYFRPKLPELPDIVYTENLTNAGYIEDPTDVATYQQVLDRMCAQALPPARTEEFLNTTLKEL